jgi:PAS domain S-box-containing protein
VELLATIDSMADGVLLVDAQARIVETNRAALELLGVSSKDDVLGPIGEWGRRFQLRTVEGRPIDVADYASVRALGGQRVAKYDAVLRHADGHDVFVSVAASPVAGAGGPPLAVAVLRDVSAAHRLEEIRDEFLSTAAHELKTPLAVIKAHAQLMQRRVPSEAQALAVVQRQVDRLSRLVQHLLDTSRLRLDEAGGPRAPFDLGSLAAEVAERMRAASPSHHIVLEPAPKAPVVADRERIERVITSLVENAIRFSPGGGEVELRVDSADGSVHVAVQDHGLGIPPDRQARIFERYYRAHAGMREDYGGLGLSLDVSREIVQRHGGRMWFESTPGVGSTFHFTLPLEAAT